MTREHRRLFWAWVGHALVAALLTGLHWLYGAPHPLHSVLKARVRALQAADAHFAAVRIQLLRERSDWMQVQGIGARERERILQAYSRHLRVVQTRLDRVRAREAEVTGDLVVVEAERRAKA